MDSKKAHGEKAKYQRLKLHLEEIHPEYETKIFEKVLFDLINKHD